MADVCEAGRASTDFHLSIAMRRQQAERPDPAGQSLTECEDCGEEIPKERRDAQPGCTRCVACQDAFEKNRRR